MEYEEFYKWCKKENGNWLVDIFNDGEKMGWCSFAPIEAFEKDCIERKGKFDEAELGLDGFEGFKCVFGLGDKEGKMRGLGPSPDECPQPNDITFIDSPELIENLQSP